MILNVTRYFLSLSTSTTLEIFKDRLFIKYDMNVSNSLFSHAKLIKGIIYIHIHTYIHIYVMVLVFYTLAFYHTHYKVDKYSTNPLTFSLNHSICLFRCLSACVTSFSPLLSSASAEFPDLLNSHMTDDSSYYLVSIVKVAHPIRYGRTSTPNWKQTFRGVVYND